MWNKIHFLLSNGCINNRRYMWMHKYEAAWNEPNKNGCFLIFFFFFPACLFCCCCPALGLTSAFRGEAVPRGGPGWRAGKGQGTEAKNEKSTPKLKKKIIKVVLTGAWNASRGFWVCDGSRGAFGGQRVHVGVGVQRKTNRKSAKGRFRLSPSSQRHSAMRTNH